MAGKRPKSGKFDLARDLDNSNGHQASNLDGDTYWRESLDKWLESLTMNILIMTLVVVDVINVLVTILLSIDTLLQQVITFVVVGLFLVELSLRMVARGVRFFHDKWNIFDTVVIYASIALGLTTFILDEHLETAGADSLQAASSTATPLRILSRIAMGLRVLRVMVHMRKVDRLRGTVATHLRTAVSQNKRRYTNHGFDLDLTYITDRIIAMSAPALGANKTYRNDIHVVSRFLSLRHYGSFFVFNLCDTCISSDGSIGQYHPQMFFNHVQRIPFEDHGPPLLLEMIHFCCETTKWLRRDPSNVIAVHCKGGKGRTGVMFAAFLLWCGHRRCAMDAMELFTFRRTENYDPDAGIDDSTELESEEAVSSETLRPTQIGKKQPNRGVDGPSQQRYVFYIEAMLYCGVNPSDSPQLLLKALSLPVGKAQEKQGWWVSYTIKCQRTKIFDSFQSGACLLGGPGRLVGEDVEMLAPVLLNGDTRIEFFRHKSGSDSKRSLLWFVVFHPAFYQNKTKIVFAKKKIDMLHKDPKCRKADASFRLELHVSSAAESEARKDETMSFQHTSGGDPKLERPATACAGDEGSSRLGVLLARAHSSLAAKCELQRLFRTHGRVVEFSKGDDILNAHSTDASLMMVDSGVAEGVVMESGSSDVVVRASAAARTAYHPCGAQMSQMDLRNGVTRVPVNMVLGRGSILGVSNFLQAQNSFFYRARTDVRVWILCGTKPAAPRGSALSVASGMRQGVSAAPDADDEIAVQRMAEIQGASDADSGRSNDGLSRASSVEIGFDGEEPEVAMPDADPGGSLMQVAKESSIPAELHIRSFRKLGALLQGLTKREKVSPGHGLQGLKSRAFLKPKAWLVRKRLNVMQSFWRVLIIDPHSKMIINKALDSLDKKKNEDVGNFPRLTQEQMLEGKATVRKRLELKFVLQLVQYSEESLHITLKFSNEQRPYKIEFNDVIDRDEFVLHMRKFLSPSSFVSRNIKALRVSTFENSDMQVEGIPEYSLPLFWQGVALQIAQEYDRSRTECVRISRLKALSDTDSLLLLYDEGEPLRLDCIMMFRLPASEKLVLTSKCYLHSDDLKMFRRKRMRIVILTDHVVLDFAVFGPRLSRRAILLRLDQLYEVYDMPHSEKAETAEEFCMKVLLDVEAGQEINEIFVSFVAASVAHDVRAQLARYCRRAQHSRTLQRQRPLLDDALLELVQVCGRVHMLREGEELLAARHNDRCEDVLCM